MENASREYSYRQVSSMVKHAQEAYGWEFLFLGANMDAIRAAETFGIRADRAVRYECDGVGTRVNYSVVSQAIGSMRSGRGIDADWDAEIRRDYAKRGRR